MAYKSKYNYFFRLDEKTWGLFNTLSQSLISMTEEEKKDFDNLSSNNIEKNSTFIFEMIKLGFLQDDFFDEKGIVDYYRFKKTFLDSSQYFRILTTTACNANCIYCYENNSPIDFMNEITASSIAKYILKNEKLENLYLHWFGGEPLLNYSIIDFIMDKIADEIGKRNIKLFSYITTNGSLLDKELINKAKNQWHISWMQITIEGILEDYDKIKRYNDKKYNFSLVIENIHQVLEQQIEVHLRVNYYINKFENAEKVIDYIISKFNNYVEMGLLKIIPAPIFNVTNEVKDKNVKNYRIFDLDLYISRKGNIPVNKFFMIKDIPCFARNSGSFVILPNGDLYKCTLAINNNNNRVGNINEGISLNKAYLKWINPVLEKECNDCFLLPLCQGGCRAYEFGLVDNKCNKYFSDIDKILKYRIRNDNNSSK